MGDKSNIEWTNSTPIVDRGGKRVRFYLRKTSNRPGTQERRSKSRLGLKWCRGCQDWLDAKKVLRQGACQPCINAETRALYARSEEFREKRKAHRDRRRRSVERMPADAKVLLTELFDGQCAYCDKSATTWDHVNPVSAGGMTSPGNMLPACVSCNSSKHDLPWEIWVARSPTMKNYTIEYLAQFGSVEWPVLQK